MTAANRCKVQCQHYFFRYLLALTYLWIILSIASVESNGLEVQTTIEVDSSHDVP